VKPDRQCSSQTTETEPRWERWARVYCDLCAVVIPPLLLIIVFLILAAAMRHVDTPNPGRGQFSVDTPSAGAHYPAAKIVTTEVWL
jgi:hypothetical protein